ncbi:Asp23/Gls24 family envelope stress response protein [Bacillus daqingensis]|uniref:Alkaline shock protein 23 n=1 Tax=Bacillus daqingensis TaxID=872396 RepID=A0ABV9NZ94_9BACI
MAQQNIESTEKLNNEEAPERKDSLTYDTDVIKKITALAIHDTKGILGMSGNVFEGIRETFGADEKITKGVSADVGEREAAIDIDVIVEYGQRVPEVYDNAKKNVKDNIRTMTGLEVVEFNMNVSDVLTRKEFEGKNERSSGRVE